MEESASDGSVIKDYGKVEYVGLRRGAGVWRVGHGLILSVGYRSNDGLVALPSTSATTRLESTSDDVSNCDFDTTGRFGACVRQSMTLPPEIDLVSPVTGTMVPLLRPNTRIADIEPLLVEHAVWINSYGTVRMGMLRIRGTIARRGGIRRS